MYEYSALLREGHIVILSENFELICWDLDKKNANDLSGKKCLFTNSSIIKCNNFTQN